jgi:hypothetical protein
MEKVHCSRGPNIGMLQAVQRVRTRTSQRPPSRSLVMSTGASPDADLQTDHAVLARLAPAMGHTGRRFTPNNR